MSTYDDRFDNTAPDGSVFVDKESLDLLSGPDESAGDVVGPYVSDGRPVVAFGFVVPTEDRLPGCMSALSAVPDRTAHWHSWDRSILPSGETSP